MSDAGRYQGTRYCCPSKERPLLERVVNLQCQNQQAPCRGEGGGGAAGPTNLNHTPRDAKNSTYTVGIPLREMKGGWSSPASIEVKGSGFGVC